MSDAMYYSGNMHVNRGSSIRPTIEKALVDTHENIENDKCDIEVVAMHPEVLL
jgi:hypothetical protein